jgi:type VI secretion system protein ImpA
MPEGLPLDIDALLAPVAEESPSGTVSFSQLKYQFDELRRQTDPEDLAPEEELKEADWRTLESQTREALAGQCKDLRITGYLIEALMKRYRFDGLVEGLKLVKGLLEQSWDYLLPGIEDGDLSSRSEPLENMLDSADKGLRLPTGVRMIPIVRGDEGKYGFLEWQAIQKGQSDRQEDFEKGVSRTTPEEAVNLVKSIEESLESLRSLRATMESRFGSNAPALVHLQEAIEDSQRLARYVKQKVTPESPDAEEETHTRVEEGDGSDSAGAAGSSMSRAGIYKQLNRLADALAKQEPHSPVPYLIRRAVQLGELPFPELIKNLIRDMNVINEINREFGIPMGETE